MVTILVPLLVAVVGALMYALTGPKPAELGRIAFACGLLVTLFIAAQHVIRL